MVPIAIARTGGTRGRSFGPLRPDHEGILDLPPGFSYRVIGRAGTPMSDGWRAPAKPDGMACFSGRDGQWVLMRNHEVAPHDTSLGPFQVGAAPAEAFDGAAYGGVTRLVIDPKSAQVISSNLVLAGTSRNCAGGPSPWGWLSCEEAGDEAGHGYVFLCDVEAPRVRAPVRLGGYGRFNHEAAAIEPSTDIAYLTEDRPDGCLYRFVPTDRRAPFVGRLQALRVVGVDGASTRDWVAGQVADVEWVDIDEPDPRDDTLRREAQGKGAATIRRGEGIWYHRDVVLDRGEIWFTATEGGPAGTGQIFRLLRGPGGDRLEVVVHSDDAAMLDLPDNVTFSPGGQLFVCEDGKDGNFLRALTSDRTLVPFARGALSPSELAGVCFSPDGRVMFVNLQHDGLTLAVTGPFA